MTALLIGDTSLVTVRQHHNSEATDTSEDDEDSDSEDNGTSFDEGEQMDTVDGLNHDDSEQDDDGNEQSGRTKDTKLVSNQHQLHQSVDSRPMPPIIHMIWHLFRPPPPKKKEKKV